MGEAAQMAVERALAVLDRALPAEVAKTIGSPAVRQSVSPSVGDQAHRRTANGPDADCIFGVWQAGA